MRGGAFTGCLGCMEVCLVGEDYGLVQQSPHRRADLRGGVQRTLAAGRIQIAWPPRPEADKRGADELTG